MAKKKFVHNKKIRHGYSGTPEYKAWCAAKGRCRNPKNKSFTNYGARGIKFSSKWDRFPDFLRDVGLRPKGRYTLERIDNSRGYEPGNCRWATYSEQNRNLRSTIRVSIKGESFCLRDACRKLGIGHTKARYNLWKGTLRDCDGDPVVLLTPFGGLYGREKPKKTRPWGKNRITTPKTLEIEE